MSEAASVMPAPGAVHPWNPLSGENPFPEMARSAGVSGIYTLANNFPSLSPLAENEDRVERLKAEYGRRGAMVKNWSDLPASLLASLSPQTLAECLELVRLGLERKAIRLAYCRRLARVYRCPSCGSYSKKRGRCGNRMCPDCADRNFDALFRRYLRLDEAIPASVRSLPGYGWHVLDFSFRHDGDAPTHDELVAMVRVIRHTVERAVAEAGGPLYERGIGCRLLLNEDGSPQFSPNGWPLGEIFVGRRKDRKREVRELVGWCALFVPEHEAPDANLRKQERAEALAEGRTKPRGGAVKAIPARWVLRFGWEFLRVTEFGFDNVNAHFHGAYFGPRLDYRYDEWALKHRHKLICSGRLVDIFREESRRPISEGGLGVESYTVFFEPAKKGFRSVLAHALKYTKKIPRSTPEGLAELEKILEGTRRVAVFGAHYGVPIGEPDRADPRCPRCDSPVGAVSGLGLVPLDQVADFPDVIEYRSPDGIEVLDPSVEDFDFAQSERAP